MKSDVDQMHKRAWDYFALHAAQRMSSFNYFVLTSGLLITSFCATYKVEHFPSWLRGAIGVAIILVAFAFWKVDQRVRNLVKHAERAMKEIERQAEEPFSGCDPSVFRLFVSEEERTAKARSRHSKNLCMRPMTYSECFGILYLVIGAFGFGVILCSVIEFISDPAK